MADRKVGHAIILACVLGALSQAFGAGCGETRNRKIMSFLFDGYRDGRDSVYVNSEEDSLEVQRTNRRLIRQARADSLRVVSEVFFHAPYADGDCSICHNMPRSKSTAAGNSAMPSLGTSQATGESWLVMPVEELCFECHDDMTEDYADENNMNIHAPVAAGECTTCHHPHRSGNEKLLLADTVKVLCFQCHDETIGDGSEDHPELEESDDCTDCHTPHLSTDEFFLE
ncbi:MAG: cytochrome c3 family protein [Candidatus Zixiibacteriota bacterium]